MYRVTKAVCLFCENTVIGNERFMLRGGNMYGTKGRIPKSLSQRPEHKWAWNGLSVNKDYECIFYLCPQHTTDEYYDKAFEWCKTQRR